MSSVYCLNCLILSKLNEDWKYIFLAGIVSMSWFFVVGTKPPFGVSPTSSTGKSTTMVPLPPPPTMPPVTPSIETGTLTTVLQLMENLLPQLESCCCEKYSTPSHDDGKILLISVIGSILKTATNTVISELLGSRSNKVMLFISVVTFWSRPVLLIFLLVDYLKLFTFLCTCLLQMSWK